MKLDINEIGNSFNDLCFNCAYIGIFDKKKKVMLFDADEHGDGEKPVLHLKFDKKYAYFAYGDLLTKEEKNKKYYYNDYEDIGSFIDESGISDFIDEYFDNIIITYSRKSKKITRKFQTH